MLGRQGGSARASALGREGPYPGGRGGWGRWVGPPLPPRPRRVGWGGKGAQRVPSPLPIREGATEAPRGVQGVPTLRPGARSAPAPAGGPAGPTRTGGLAEPAARSQLAGASGAEGGAGQGRGGGGAAAAASSPAGCLPGPPSRRRLFSCMSQAFPGDSEQPRAARAPGAPAAARSASASRLCTDHGEGGPGRGRRRQRQRQPQQQPRHLGGLLALLLPGGPRRLRPGGRSRAGRRGQPQQSGFGGRQSVWGRRPQAGAGARGRAQQIHQPPSGLAEQMMNQVEGQQKNLVHAIESLPGSGPLTALDQDLLLLKATSAATLSCLGECLHLLQQSVQQVGQPSHKPGASENILGWHGPKSHSTEQLKNGTFGSLPSASASVTWAVLPDSAEDEPTFQPEPEPNSGPELVLSEDERSDTEDMEETELGVVEDQRSVILHLISQLKLGMDLTRVVLPTFILEKRSLLEMYADFMAHPDLLLAIAAAATPEERVICFVEYYLTAFQEGRKGALAKKPYNPIIGETFHCSWEVPQDRVKPKRTAPHSPTDHEPLLADDSSKSYKLRFVAEQVSHHPPISCFYCECKEKRLCINTHIWTKSKFMGMSVGVSMIGEGVLRLLEHGEEYVFTLPSAYARSILTVPWVELGGKVSVACAKTGYTATVTFHTKPFYGGKVHRVTAEVKHNPSNTIVCKAHGEWNGTLEFTYSNGETRVIDTTALLAYPKRIRPLEKQGPLESRKLWREVTRHLRLGDIDAATEQKRCLEEKQRVEERKRENLRTPWQPKYFIQEGDGWVYFNPLWKAH
nr:oxysterol-binding protein-related protein 10 isoform X1 [Manis javanica]